MKGDKYSEVDGQTVLSRTRLDIDAADKLNEILAGGFGVSSMLSYIERLAEEGIRLVVASKQGRKLSIRLRRRAKLRLRVGLYKLYNKAYRLGRLL